MGSLLILYKSFIRSKLDYASIVYGSASSTLFLSCTAAFVIPLDISSSWKFSRSHTIVVVELYGIMMALQFLVIYMNNSILSFFQILKQQYKL